MGYFRKHLPVIVIVLVGLVIFWMVMRLLSPQRQVEAYKKMLVANGEKLEIEEVLPPPIPPEQNGADIVEKADALLLPHGDDWTNMPPMMRIIMPDKAVVGFEQPDARDNYFTNSWLNIMKAANVGPPATELLRQVMNYPALDFHINYGPEAKEQLTNFTDLCSQRLLAEAICDLRESDAASATTNISIILTLVNGEHDERFLDYQFDRRAMTFQAAMANWELLQSSNVTDADLTFLQKNWQRLEYIQALEETILMRRAILESTIKRMRDSEAYFKSRTSWENSLDSDGWSGLFPALHELEMGYGNAMWHSSWTYSDELQMLRDYQLVLQTIGTIETNHFYGPATTNLMSQLEAITRSHGSSDLSFIRWMFSGSILEGEEIERTMQVEAAKSMLVAAIALKRFELKNGNYPLDLNSLVPEFLAAVPADPVDGKPLRYCLKPDETFLLYSIGPDGKDDGGDASLTDGLTHYYWLDLRARDWVWPEPASSEEIQN